MQTNTLKTTLALSLGLSLSACDLTALKKADSDVQQPATEATVIGTWRSDIPVNTTTPPSVIKVTMVINADHTMLLSQRVATGQPAPLDYVEIAHENWTWSVADGKITSVKTDCQYKVPTDPINVASTTCTAPTTKTSDINVKGAAWTVLGDDNTPVVFRKD